MVKEPLVDTSLPQPSEAMKVTLVDTVQPVDGPETEAAPLSLQVTVEVHSSVAEAPPRLFLQVWY
jgi:hypothetical protein